MRSNIFFNSFLLLIISLLLCAAQTTLWPVITTSIQPHIWICVLTYISLYRDSKPAFLLLLLLSILIKSFTLFPISYLLLSIALTHFIISQIKDKTFWKGLSYYLICTFVATITFGFILNIIEYISYGDPTLFKLSDWVFSSLLNIPFAVLLYALISRIDRITSMPLPAETGYNQYG